MRNNFSKNRKSFWVKICKIDDRNLSKLKIL